VFSKAASKTLNLTRISYILASPAANLEYEPVKELQNLQKRRKPLLLASTPSIVSSDGKTYVRTLKKTLKSTQPPPLPKIGRYSAPPPPARPAQVVVDTVSAFYQDEASPASHNAVLQTLSPSMRKSLKARRIRGGAGTTGFLHRLEIAGYFGAWYALNVIYNSECVDVGTVRMDLICL
jgi:hypothetical protein